MPVRTSAFSPSRSTRAIAFNASNGKITWWHQYTPNDNCDYDETESDVNHTRVAKRAKIA
jgi:glucose dehydrogenase